MQKVALDFYSLRFPFTIWWLYLSKTQSSHFVSLFFKQFSGKQRLRCESKRYVCVLLNNYFICQRAFIEM